MEMEGVGVGETDQHEYVAPKIRKGIRAQFKEGEARATAATAT